MNKSKIVLMAVGGVFAVLVLGAGWFVYDAVSARDAARDGNEEQGTEGLVTIEEKAATLSRKSIYPCSESQKAIEANRQKYLTWKDEAHDLAARGDKVFAQTTPPAFKEFLISDAKRLMALPGGVAGHIAKETFAFGPFGEFITGAKMPEGDLPRLQRQWDDVAFLIETLSQAGVAEIVEVSFDVAQPKAAEAPARKNARPGNKSRANAKAAEGKAEPKTVRQTYRLTFNTRPSGFVKALNALTVCERFVVVDEFSFRRTKDAIVDALSGEKKDAEGSGSSRRRRSRRGEAEAEQPKDAPATKNGVITDPQTDDPMNVTLAVSVYDFGSLEEEKK